MARRRLHLRRTLALVLLLAVLTALLELNQLVPGVWPGGGEEGGFRRDLPIDAEADRLRPGSGETLPGEGTVTVTARLVDGTTPASWRLQVASGTKRVPDGRGGVAVGPGGWRAPFFRVLVGDVPWVEHRPADPRVAPSWLLHLPASSALPSGPPSPTPYRLQVVDAQGAPIPGASVRVGDATRTWTTDADGSVVLDLAGGVRRALVTGAGRVPRTVWIHPAQPPPHRVVLDARRSLAVRFVDAEDGSSVAAFPLLVRAADGAVLREANAPRTSWTIDDLGEAEAKGAVLEVGGPAHGIVRVPLPALPPVLSLSRGRAIRLLVTDPGHRRLPGAFFEAEFVPPVVLGEAAPLSAEPVEVTVRGKMSLVLPEGVEARVAVGAPHSAPRALRIGRAEEGKRPVDVLLDPAFALPVEVRDSAGQPLVGAEIVVAAALDGGAWERRGTTDVRGLTRIDVLPRGPLEVYAHAPGHAWAVTTARVVRRMEPIAFRLEKGAPVRLIVETPLGIPVEDARVRAEPTDGGAPDVVPPHPRPWRTDADGTLVLHDLRLRPYRVEVARPGYEKVVLHGIMPGESIHFVTLRPSAR